MDKEIVINRWFCMIIRENIRLIVNKQSISEKKKNKNLHLLYSTLKPDTNSLSPSARSNGVRLNSINHSTIRGPVRRRSNTIGVTLLLLTTPINATTTLKEKYIKIIGKNLYLLATIKSLSIIKINIITQEYNSFFYYQKVTSFID